MLIPVVLNATQTGAEYRHMTVFNHPVCVETIKKFPISAFRQSVRLLISLDCFTVKGSNGKNNCDVHVCARVRVRVRACPSFSRKLLVPPLHL